jgi:hypothetical protein
MNDDLNKALATLAEKLGVNTEHLYGALLRQAYFAGLWNVTTAVLMLAALWIGILAWFRQKHKPNQPDYANWSVSPVVVVIAITVSIFMFDGVYYGVSYLTNPDYFVLRHLGIVDR